MTAEPPENPVTKAARSLEVRWIFPGQLETAVTGWFARFPARTESREDTYLLDPQLRGLSVKVRGGEVLEVKAYCGSPGMLEVAGRARGRMEYWQKWSFPFSPLGPGSGDPAAWRPVRKRRRISRFSLASGQLDAPGQGLGEQPRCEVELTEVQTGGQDWWTLGFEATGPADLLRSELQASAVLVFVQALPGDVKPGPQASRSYAEWLGQLSAPTVTPALSATPCAAPDTRHRGEAIPGPPFPSQHTPGSRMPPRLDPREGPRDDHDWKPDHQLPANERSIGGVKAAEARG